MVYYLQQHSTILSQISQQIASIAPQVSIPSTPPLPFPPFNPSASNIRINAFWFMALAFSLFAALLAILVQQWVRDYMHVFQRYSDPQKSARMRQYLYEGSEGWYMPIVAEAVPGLLHLSLFLFFAGLADSTLNINTTIGLSTTIPIGICGLLYIFTTLAPVIYPQSPYQTSFSGLIWYAIQISRGRIFKDRDGVSKSVSTNMAQGQMQLSMEETKDRKGRDKRAILWLLDNLTEDAEIESFVMSMPGSLEVWTEFSNEDVIPVVGQPPSRFWTIRNFLGSIPRQFRTTSPSRSSTNVMEHRRALHLANTHRSIVTASIHEGITIRESCWRIGHFFDTCKNRASFASDELWRERARACVEVMASLIFYADAEVGWFGDTRQVLGDIGRFEDVHNLPLARRDEAFVVSWTCLSIMAIRPTLKTNSSLNEPKLATSGLFLRLLYDPRVICDSILERQWSTEHEWDLSSKISFAADRIREIDGIDPDADSLNETIDKVSQRIIHQLPVDFDFPQFPDSELFLRVSFELFQDPSILRFISCRQSPNKFLDYLERIDGYQPNLEYEIEKVLWPKHLLQRRSWNLQDLRYGGGLGFAVELFLFSLRQLLSTYPSQESYSVPYIITLKAITSDRRRINSPGTQKILLDAVASDHGILRTFDYPDYITDEVWELLGDMLEGQTGPHISSAMQQLTEVEQKVGGRYGAKAWALKSRLRSQQLSTPTDLE